jgi:ElaB/YqjD/DUF883 family membrane-anchored ribosome-binding protein
MAEEPDVIREQIEQTRERVGETVDALSEKANVKGRAKDRLGGMKEAMSDQKDAVVSTIRRGTGQGAGAMKGGTGRDGAAKKGARKTASLAQDNPLVMALGAVAAGFLVGSRFRQPTWRTASSGPRQTK